MTKIEADRPGPWRAADVTALQHDRMMHVSRLATLGEMAAGIAHEVNQPLTAITNYAHACNRFLDAAQPDLEEVRAVLREIGAEALRAGDIIRRLRQLVGKPHPEPVADDLNEVIEEARVLILADARHYHTQVRFELAPRLPAVNLDRVQIQHVLLNLVRNALEALTERPQDRREIAIRTALRPDGHVELTVADNGPGAAPPVVDRMFDPFVTTKPAGTGLGLPISRTILHAHGGKIGYRPVIPAGASFYLEFPPR